MAFDAYLKVNCNGVEIEGESTDKGHEGSIEVLSYSWGVNQPYRALVVSQGGPPERVSFQDFAIVKAVDKASPLLFRACCEAMISDITLELCRAGGKKEKYMSYEIEGAVVSSFQPSSGADLPTESITFSFAKVIMTYVEMEHGTGRVRGNITHEHDLRDNTSR